MPQTRFVLKKALALGKKPIVVVNKIDRPMARPAEVVDEVLDLFIELGADDDQLEFPVVYASGRDGYASTDPDKPGTDLRPLLDMIINEIQPPQNDIDGTFQMLFLILNMMSTSAESVLAESNGVRLKKGRVYQYVTKTVFRAVQKYLKYLFLRA